MKKFLVYACGVVTGAYVMLNTIMFGAFVQHLKKERSEEESTKTEE